MTHPLGILLLLAIAMRAMADDAQPQARSAFSPNLTAEFFDAGRSRAEPGAVPASPKVLRIGGTANHVEGWRSAATPEPGPSTFLIAFTSAVEVGTVLALGSWQIHYLQPGADAGNPRPEDWLPAAYPGDPGHNLLAVPLPAGVRTRAIRLTGARKPDSSGQFSDTLWFATTLAGRFVNVAPLADVFVSSCAPPDQGFRPRGRANRPDVLADGDFHSTWSNAPREHDISAEEPEWIVLDWGSSRRLRGTAVFLGDGGFGRIEVQAWTSDDRPSGRDAAGWKTVGALTARRPWRPIIWEVAADFGTDVQTRALRYLIVRGLTPEMAEGGEGANPRMASIAEIAVFEDLGNRPCPGRLARETGIPQGVIPLTFTMPWPGRATIQILSEAGEVVENLFAGAPFPAGTNTVWWDLSTLDDYWPPYQKPAPHFSDPSVRGRELAAPGRYRWRGLCHPGLSLRYLYSFNPIKKSGLAWITADGTGGWLADHSPPLDIVRTGDTMAIGSFCEGGHALIETDLDMNKLWGTARIHLACPRVLAAEGPFDSTNAAAAVYFLEKGGWLGFEGREVCLIRVDWRTKAGRRVFAIPREEKDPVLRSVEGLVVRGSTAFIADRSQDAVLVCDLAPNLAGTDEKIHVLNRIAVPGPGRLRPCGTNHLACISRDGVALIALDSFRVTPVVTGLASPFSLAVDREGRFYVGETAPQHQVKVFSPQGKLLRTIGRPGPHRVGRFDPDNLENPVGLEIDAAGRLWVCESSMNVKRVSVWDSRGRCVQDVIGPPEYGGSGGGGIDPEDENRFFYRSLEIRRDPRTGMFRPVNVIWRDDDERYDCFFPGAPHNFSGAAPAYPFRHDGRLFFTSWQGWAGGAQCTLFIYDRDHVRPVAAVGTIPDWMWKRLGRDIPDARFGRVVMRRVDPQIDFSWSGSPAEGMGPDDFAVRWEGTLGIAQPGAYRLITTSDDGVRLCIDGRTIIDNWTDHAQTENSASVELAAGRHPIRLDFYEKTGGASIRLEWEGPGIGRQIVPRTVLAPSNADEKAEGLLGTYYQGGPGESIFAWTDENDDGRVQPPEVRTGTITFEGAPWRQVAATWQTRMNDRFEIAFSDGEYGRAGIAFFNVRGFNRRGYPLYELPKSFVPIPGLAHASDAVMRDRAGNAISLDEYVVSVSPDGRILWRYKNRWPGLHAGHYTTAAGDEPGVLIATTRFLGSAVVNETLGEVIAILSNLGATYLFTADGLYIDRVFQDCRQGLSWSFNAPPSDELLKRVSLGDEHFGGTFQKVKTADGSFRCR